METKLETRLKDLRTEANLSQEKLGEELGKNRATIRRWENDASSMPLGMALRLASRFGKSISQFLGVKPPAADESNVEVYHDTTTGYGDDVIDVPVFRSDNFPVCAGPGAYSDGGVAEADHMEKLPAFLFGTPQTRAANNDYPFVAQVSGDSMEEDGIYEGNYICVNPLAVVRDGDIALCYFDYQVFIKHVYWDNEGGGELRAASDRYPVYTFTHQDILDNRFVLIGRVMYALQKF